MDGRLLSFWDGTFSGAMLNFGGVPKNDGLENAPHFKIWLFWIPMLNFRGVYHANGSAHQEGVKEPRGDMFHCHCFGLR